MFFKEIAGKDLHDSGIAYFRCDLGIGQTVCLRKRRDDLVLGTETEFYEQLAE